MLYAVRLKPFNKKQGNFMRSYTAVSGNTYRVGIGNQPSPVKIVDDKDELNELKQEKQFEIMKFEDRKELEKFLDNETAKAIRTGLVVARPDIQDASKPKTRDAIVPPPAKREVSPIAQEQPERTSESVLDDEDATVTKIEEEEGDSTDEDFDDSFDDGSEEEEDSEGEDEIDPERVEQMKAAVAELRAKVEQLCKDKRQKKRIALAEQELEEAEEELRSYLN